MISIQMCTHVTTDVYIHTYENIYEINTIISTKCFFDISADFNLSKLLLNINF